MSQVEEPSQPHLSVGWQNGPPGPGDPGLEQAAAYAAVLARTLTAAGYQPRQLDLGLRRGRLGVLQLTVRGDVPRITEADFDSVARVTLNAASVRLGLAGVHLSTRLSQQPAELAVRNSRPWGAIGRVAAGIVLGCLLGVVGLPRLNLAVLQPPTPLPVPTLTTENVVREEIIEPTATPALSGVPAAGPRAMIMERFTTALANWPNDPQGTAWFTDGAFRLAARQPNRFVAVGVPLPGALGDTVVRAQFHKVGGPAGGGYGLIVRDQSAASERDSRNQAGQYLVLEVGDGGDIGVWQRDQTHWIDIVPWTHSNAVHRDLASNALAASTRGSDLRFEVNGEVVADLTYDGLPVTGGVGVFVGGDLNQVALEWLQIEG